MIAGAYVAVCLASGALLASAGTAQASTGREHRAVVIHVTASASSVPALGSVTFTITATNRSRSTLTQVRLGNSIVTAGSPGSAPVRWSPPLGFCGAAAGTAYCNMPPLAPGASIREAATVTVPLRLGGSHETTIGSTVGITAFIQGRGGQYSRFARTSVKITRPSSLPTTGRALTHLLWLGLAAIAIGVVTASVGRSARER
jgi:hypothetical protein